MKSYILDTSVAVAWYLPEVFSDAARHWQKLLLENKLSIYVPSLHYLEFANVLRTYVKRNELDEYMAKEIYDLHLNAPLKVLDLTLSEILNNALEYNSTTYDAAYISLSKTYEYPLITAEKTTTPWAVKLGNLVEFVK